MTFLLFIVWKDIYKSAETKKYKIHSSNFFVFQRSTVMQIHIKICQKMRRPLHFKCRFFQNPCPNPVFLSRFWLIFGSDGQPPNACNLNHRELRGHWPLFETRKDKSITYVKMNGKGEIRFLPPLFPLNNLKFLYLIVRELKKGLSPNEAIFGIWPNNCTFLLYTVILIH